MTPYPFNVKTKLTQKIQIFREKEFQEIRENGSLWSDRRWERGRDINLIYYEI